MTAQQAKGILMKKYSSGTISNRYFYINGKYYSGITFNKIPDGVKLHFPDRSFLGVSIDSENGQIEDFSSFDLYDAFSLSKADPKNW